MEYIIDAKPQLYDINEEEYNNIVSKLDDGIILTESERTLFLNYFITMSRYIFERHFNVDIHNDPLKNRCDFAQHIVGRLLERHSGIKVYPKETQDVFSSSCTGHSFLVCEIQGIPYLIDLTYRQFFLKEDCSKEKFFVKNNMVLISPSPGYFITMDDEGRATSEDIIREGYVKLDKTCAKKYGDSFYFTKTGVREYSDIPGNIYLKMLLKENYDYAVNDDRFKSMYGKVL